MRNGGLGRGEDGGMGSLRETEVDSVRESQDKRERETDRKLIERERDRKQELGDVLTSERR